MKQNPNKNLVIPEFSRVPEGKYLESLGNVHHGFPQRLFTPLKSASDHFLEIPDNVDPWGHQHFWDDARGCGN